MAEGERRGIFEWFTRRHALRAARQSVKDLPTQRLEFERRARLSSELADRVFDPVEPLRAGSGLALAIDLYRQAAYWAVAATDGEPGSAEAEFWNRVVTRLPGTSTPEAEARSELGKLLADGSFRTFADLPEPERRTKATAMRDLAHALIAEGRAPREQVNRLLRQRLWRAGLLTPLVLLIGIGAALAIDQATKPANLAQGKPWKTSSEYHCKLDTKTCDGARTNIFFHTKEDEKPWIEYDLGKPTQFSSVFVRNRTDEVPDRALPLVVEVSTDKKRWKEVIRRTESFRTWTANFKTRTARYVRLRVDKKSFLHLEAVEIYP